MNTIWIMKSTPARLAAFAAFGTLALVLSGCATGGGDVATETAPIAVAAQPAPVAVAAKPVSGKVHGGQQPISGATVQLYAVGTTGVQSASTPLIASTVTTAADGSFNITGLWDCTSNTATYGVNPQLYMVATGGNPGLAPNTNNQAIALVAALGPCSNITSSSFIWVNEVTTVAAVYALAPFMADYADVGASGPGAPGLVNAFQTAAALANTTNGTAPGAGLPANATVPLAELNTLADLIAICVNSNGADANCSGLFAAVTASGGSPPPDTVAATLSIAHRPARNATALFNMVFGKASPFQPMLINPPSDWSVAMHFTGGGLNAPTGIAIDAGGNAWVANAGGNSVTELSSNGTPLTGSAGYTGNSIFGAQAVAIDRAGNVWLADTLLSSIVELTVTGGAIHSTTSYTAGGISGPTGIAIDSGNNVWVSNFAGGSVTELNSSGVPVGSSPLTANGTLQSPFSIAIDAAGNVWVADNSAAIVAEFANGQSLLSGTGYTDGGVLAPTGIALDTSGRAWVTNSGANAVSLFAANGSPVATSPITGSGLHTPAAVAISGAGVAWVANYVAAGGISPIASAATGPAATSVGSLNTPTGVAIDASGSIWTANTGDNSVSEFIGLAAPVVTPLALTVGP
jgi:sugar lactone lactonase YvrE